MIIFLWWGQSLLPSHPQANVVLYRQMLLQVRITRWWWPLHLFDQTLEFVFEISNVQVGRHGDMWIQITGCELKVCLNVWSSFMSSSLLWWGHQDFLSFDGSCQSSDSLLEFWNGEIIGYCGPPFYMLTTYDLHWMYDTCLVVFVWKCIQWAINNMFLIPTHHRKPLLFSF